MKGIITAAARSPRLLPLTKNTPVSMLEVAGRPILDHQLDALQDAGVRDIVVITGFCTDQVEGLCRGKATCIYNPFYEVCNVAMNLWLVRQELKSGFLLLYDDTLFETQLFREVLAEDDGIILVVDPKGIDREAEKVVLRRGLVSAMGKDVEAPHGEFVGMAKFGPGTIPALVAELEQVARTDLATSFPRLIRRLIDNGQEIRVHTTDRPWIDIDFPSDLEEARRTWQM
ncbi:MAG: phosphocholine cytidylyltransferase family protein [Dehalococcoidia bacterium]|nr:phosphocholine cytidylyltransferase family protein [Dehalococcoidia bacterium]MBL7165895.1 phosphocholine cytidylyltransferase family protein [Dehalococcoidales bacterium]